MISIENFYPKYPFIDPISDDLNPYVGVSFNDAIVTKKEFREKRLDRLEPLPQTAGSQLKHQQYIAEFMSAKTGYDRLLLFHAPGTGKTCTAISVAERLKESKLYQGAIICAKGDGLLNNFKQELVFTCTKGQYIPENYETLTELQKIHRINKSVNVFYSFVTFETFARELSTISDELLIQRYDSHVIIIDEVHNLRDHTSSSREDDDDDDDNAAANEDDDAAAAAVTVQQRNRMPLDIYAQFHRLLHLLTRAKVLLMSGTPIKDTADEFGSVMNLILPLDKQFVTDKAFIDRYFGDSTNSELLTNKNEFIDKIRGHVSYLKTATSDILKREVGVRIGKLKHFIVSVDRMSAFQSRAYENAYNADMKSKSIYINSRQAALFVFPDGSAGQSGFKKYITVKHIQSKITGTSHTKYEANNEFKKAVSAIDRLEELSSKYAFLIKTILSKPNQKHFIYCQYVNGSGLITLSLILNQFGYSAATGSETTKGKRYALLTRQTSSIKSLQRLINRFNSDDNLYGDYISIVLGSRVVNEGFTFKCIRNEFILTGHWNYAETMQAIARGWRFGSHSALVERGEDNITVDVYQQVSLPTTTTTTTNIKSIDLELYEVSERKDVINKQIEKIVKETAFDCPLTIARNKILGYDGQRECDYDRCNYTCDGKIGQVVDKSTYNLNPIISSVNQRIKELFKRNRQQFYSFDDLLAEFPELDEYELSTALHTLVKSDDLYIDRFGLKKFLRFHDNTLFLSTDPKTDESILSEYYSRNLVLENGDNFDTILAETYDNALPRKVQELFDYPELTRILIVNLPPIVQREILAACVLARDVVKTTKNAAVRDDILRLYEGFFGVRSVNGIKMLSIWLYSDTLGAICYDDTGKNFKPCRIDGGLASIKSPVGYMGLFNPTSNDFCLRNTDIDEKHDLRKVTVGRRCQNYEYNVLLDLIAKRMQIAAPKNYTVAGLTTTAESDDDNIRNELMKIVNSNAKYAYIAKTLTDKDSITDIKRFLYWANQSKDNMCSNMKSWFRDKNLLETNFDCGTQKKSRSKFIA